MGKFKEIDILRGDLKYYPAEEQKEKMDEWGVGEDARKKVSDWQRQLEEKASCQEAVGTDSQGDQPKPC
jgi:hypothetical protein